MLRGKRLYYSCYGENGYIIIHSTGKTVILFMLRGKRVYYYSCYGENGYIIIHATGKTGSFEISFQVMKGLELLMGSKGLKKVAKSKNDSFVLRPKLKSLRLKHSWFHLKLYSAFRDFSRRIAQLEPVFGSWATWFKLFKFGLFFIHFDWFWWSDEWMQFTKPHCPPSTSKQMNLLRVRISSQDYG